MMAAAHSWSTSCFGDSAETTPMELSSLGEHLALCNTGGARRVAMQCGVQRLQDLMMARRVSALAMVMVVIGIGWYVV